MVFKEINYFVRRKREKMTHILSFMFGALLILCFIEVNTKQLRDHFQFAYQLGRDDGENLARFQYQLTDEQMRYECEILHWETLDGMPR